MQRRAAEESLTDHGTDNSNGRAHVGDAIRHKPGILGFLRQIGFMGATGAQAVQIPAFKWVNTTIGNIKNSIRGTYHAIRPKHVPRYLAQFEYRFNRRYRLEDMITRLAWVALRTPAMPYRLLKLAENGA